VAEEEPIDEATLIRRNQRVVSRDLAGQSGAVLLHLDTAAYHGVNEVGRIVWSLVGDSSIRFDDLITQLQPQLEEVPPSLADEISAFLLDLKARDLISLEPGGPRTP
jgi:coenzyme PQQ synthesis protein D (PqqD)